MEDIIIKKERPVPAGKVSLRLKRINVALDEYLLAKLRNIVNGQKASGSIRYNSVSDFIRQACQSYQVNPNITRVRQLGNPRVPFLILLTNDLYQLYQSWPKQQRAAQLENIILTYLDNI